MFFSPLPSLISFVFFVSTLASGATRLPDTEVEALRKVGETLGKTNWNFHIDPCSGDMGWVTLNATEGSENAVTCNCSFNSNTLCHVVSIILKKQNLPGRLPGSELFGLPYLQEFDVTRNYLSGSLPPEWGSMPLVNISVLGNRLTGPIPKEFGNISTLANLTLDINQLSGALPRELGDLHRLEKMTLSSNNFTGELPENLAKLTTLKDFKINDNSFTGKIPDFIGNWTNIEKLSIQASGLDGPIPFTISLLTKMTELRITDLIGTEEGKFPPLDNLKNLKQLILRSCNIGGQLPPFLGSLGSKDFKILDLSFNKLSGKIPDNFGGLLDTDYIYLTGNLLSGPIPGWMLDKGEIIDLSYNNLSFESSVCQQRSVNLFRSSSKHNTLGDVPCLRNSNCSQLLSYFHINCGGNEDIDDGNTKYEADRNYAGTGFVQGGSNWGYSSTGHFLDDRIPIDSFILDNKSRIYGNNSKLYMDARISPLSLTYYGFCLRNGNYTVKLHFAEINFTDDNTYSSLGRRIFDVYIQGIRVLQDFNIETEAGGVGRVIIKNFTAVVNTSTLEIRFYWAGKGTTAIPDRGVYGPLISAISVVDPDFDTSPNKGNSLSAGTVVGIVVAIASALFLVLGFLWWKGCLQRKNSTKLDLKGLDLQTGLFTLRQIRAATNNFDTANKIGEGGFGPVYRGLLSDGTIIAVKQLSSKSKQGNREFVNEIGMISALQHPHLVKLYGCCIEGDQLLLVYEYMENNSLARALFGPEECRLDLDWPTRYKICIGIARGLAYLHEESRLKIVHRDIKATNVLLDKDLNSKISDFGLAKLDEEDNTHISTRIAGTFGYMAPEYAMRGYLTDKADVYSFGIVALEIVSGRSNTSSRSKEDSFYLHDWAIHLKEAGNLIELVDPRMGSIFNEEEAMVMINIAILCINVSPIVRPAMSKVVSMLEGRVVSQEFHSYPSVPNDMITPKELKNQYQQTLLNSTDDSQIQSMSIHNSWTASSTSTADLYPVNFESEYLKHRD